MCFFKYKIIHFKNGCFAAYCLKFQEASLFSSITQLKSDLHVFRLVGEVLCIKGSQGEICGR